MSRPLRVGVVGCGGIAQMMHLPTLAERPDLFSIAGLVDIDARTLAAVGNRYGVAERYRDDRALFARKDIDAVLLLAGGSHRDACLRAIASSKHVFVEKPVGFSLAEAQDVARASRRRRITLMVGYHKRFDPAYRRAREAVRGFSDLRFAEVTVLHPDDGAYRSHHAVLPTRTWRETKESDMDAGARAGAIKGSVAAAMRGSAGASASNDVMLATSMLFQSLIHDVNAVRGILGEPREVLSAHVWRGGMAQTSLTRFEGNTRLAMSWISVPGLKHYEETLRFVSPESRVTLTFPSPYLRHFPTPLTIERRDRDALVVEQHTVSYEEAFRAELHHFRDCALSGRPPELGIDEALGDARWIEAIARRLSGGSGRVAQGAQKRS